MVIIEQKLDDQVQILFFLSGTRRDAMGEEKHVSDATATVLSFQLGRPTFIRQGALLSLWSLLNGGYIRCGRAFFPLLYVEGNFIAFSERLEAVSLDR